MNELALIPYCWRKKRWDTAFIKTQVDEATYVESFECAAYTVFLCFSLTSAFTHAGRLLDHIPAFDIP